MKILQIGLGGFGKKHALTWNALGKGESLTIAEAMKDTLEANSKAANVPLAQCTADYTHVIRAADIVDIVTPATTHATLIAEALEAGKDVFVEKPMTMNSDEAKRVAALVHKTKRVLQVGFHYRYHPFTAEAKRLITTGALGEIRYVSGNFKGFKRPRTDVGATHSDAIHFFDLVNYLLDGFPITVSTTMRDYFPRGSGRRMDDLSITTFDYPKNILVKIEAGYVQIAEGTDPAVPGALAEQSIEISGSKAMLRIDYLNRKATLYKAHHVQENGMWKGVNDGTETLNIAFKDPIACELEAFLEAVKTRSKPMANADDSGVKLAAIIEAAYASAASGESVTIHYEEH